MFSIKIPQSVDNTGSSLLYKSGYWYIYVSITSKLSNYCISYTTEGENIVLFFNKSDILIFLIY